MLFLVVALGAVCAKMWLDFREYVLVPIDIHHAKLDRGNTGGRYPFDYEEMNVRYEYEFKGIRYTSRIFECKWYGQRLILTPRPTYQSRVKNMGHVAFLNGGTKFYAWVSVSNPRHACIFRDGHFAVVDRNEKVD